MPKLIDHQERKQHIAQAVWAVLAREGVRGVSVRTVAAEAGISTGSLRHVFPILNDMMLYSLDYSGQRFLASLTSRKVTGPLIDHLEDLLFDFVPTSNESRMYSEVVVGMLAEASNIPGVARMLQQQETELAYTYSFILSQLKAHGRTRSDIDVQYETDTLVSLLFGVHVSYMLSDQTASDQELQAPLKMHLASLKNTD